MRKISKTGALVTEIKTSGGRRLGAGRKPAGTAMTGQEQTRRWRQKRQSPFQSDVKRLETAMEKLAAISPFEPAGPPSWWRKQNKEPLEITRGRVSKYA
jgi:hypothetical protein